MVCNSSCGLLLCVKEPLHWSKRRKTLPKSIPQICSAPLLPNWCVSVCL